MLYVALTDKKSFTSYVACTLFGRTVRERAAPRVGSDSCAQHELFCVMFPCSMLSPEHGNGSNALHRPQHNQSFDKQSSLYPLASHKLVIEESSSHPQFGGTANSRVAVRFSRRDSGNIGKCLRSISPQFSREISKMQLAEDF